MKFFVTSGPELMMVDHFLPSQHATSAQGVLNVVKTSLTFRPRSVDDVQAFCIHWVDNVIM